MADQGVPVTSPRFEARYRLDREIGRGGMGVVWRARELATDRDLAIKFYRVGLFDERAARARFEQEARILADLGRTGNRHLVQVHGYGEEDEWLYIAFEFVDGETLRHRLDAGWDRTLREVLQLLDGLCLGLSALHQRQVVHQDLKPANVILTREGAPRIIDLGIALTLEQRKRQAGDGLILGTPHYMSPEQCAERAVTYRSDLYALGVLAYELLVGTPPFWGRDALAILDQHLNAAPTPPQARLPTIPAPVSDLVLRLLAKDPEARPSSALALRSELQELARRVDVHVPVAEAARTQSPRPRPGAAAAADTVQVGPAAAPDDDPTPERNPGVRAAPAATSPRRSPSLRSPLEATAALARPSGSRPRRFVVRLLAAAVLLGLAGAVLAVLLAR